MITWLLAVCSIGYDDCITSQFEYVTDKACYEAAEVVHEKFGIEHFMCIPTETHNIIIEPEEEE